MVCTRGPHAQTHTPSLLHPTEDPLQYPPLSVFPSLASISISGHPPFQSVSPPPPLFLVLSLCFDSSLPSPKCSRLKQGTQKSSVWVCVKTAAALNAHKTSDADPPLHVLYLKSQTLFFSPLSLPQETFPRVACIRALAAPPSRLAFIKHHLTERGELLVLTLDASANSLLTQSFHSRAEVLTRAARPRRDE